MVFLQQHLCSFIMMKFALEMGHLEGFVLITITSSVFIQRYKRGEWANVHTT